MQKNTLTSETRETFSRLKTSPMTMEAISEGESELIYGGKHEQDHRIDRPEDRQSKPWMGGKFLGQSWGNGFVINIYQINLAINTILGGSGNSIVNMQANSSANA